MVVKKVILFSNAIPYLIYTSRRCQRGDVPPSAWEFEDPHISKKILDL
jgi:hypothetical protein